MKHTWSALIHQVVDDDRLLIEVLADVNKWNQTNLATVIAYPGNQYRIKPPSFLINGVECPRPIEGRPEDSTLMLWVHRAKNGGKDFRGFRFASDADLLAVVAAVLKPFEESA